MFLNEFSYLGNENTGVFFYVWSTYIVPVKVFADYSELFWDDGIWFQNYVGQV